MRRYQAQAVAIPPINIPELCVAYPDGVLQHGLEYRLKLTRRAGNDRQHVSSGCLLLQGFAQLTEQSRVLNGDNCLVGKGLNELQLFVCKGADFHSENDDRADRLSIPKQRNTKKAPEG